MKQALANGRYFEQSFGLPAVKVLPGEYCVSTRPTVLVTVVGTCLALCLRDTVKGIGGLSHFTLPEGSDDDGDPLLGVSRHGGSAIELLIAHLVELGARRERLHAALFGGAQLLEEVGAQTIGERTAQFTLAYLARLGIPIDRQDLFETYPRKIYFFPSSGKVLVRKLRTAQSGSLAQRELRHRRHLARGGSGTVPASGDAAVAPPASLAQIGTQNRT